MFGAVIASGRDRREVFGFFRPGFDLEAPLLAAVNQPSDGTARSTP
jgi:hypothetical protein